MMSEHAACMPRGQVARGFRRARLRAACLAPAATIKTAPLHARLDMVHSQQAHNAMPGTHSAHTRTAGVPFSSIQISTAALCLMVGVANIAGWPTSPLGTEGGGCAAGAQPAVCIAVHRHRHPCGSELQLCTAALFHCCRRASACWRRPRQQARRSEPRPGPRPRRCPTLAGPATRGALCR